MLDVRADSGSTGEAGCAELCWQRMRKVLRVYLKVFFTFGSWTNQTDTNHHFLEHYSWSIYQNLLE